MTWSSPITDSRMRRSSGASVSPPCMTADRSGQLDVAVACLPEEVLLETELHQVCLRSGDEHAVLAGWQHFVGQDDNPVVAGVHDTYGRDVAERPGVLRCLPADLRGDVLCSGVRLDLCGVAGLRDADRNRRLPGHSNGGGDTHHIHVVVLLALIGRPDRKVALLVRSEPDCGTGDVLPEERRNHHRVRRRDLGAVAKYHRVLGDVSDRRSETSIDVLATHEHAEQGFAVRQPTDAEVAQERLGVTYVNLTFDFNSARR